MEDQRNYEVVEELFAHSSGLDWAGMDRGWQAVDLNDYGTGEEEATAISHLRGVLLLAATEEHLHHYRQAHILAISLVPSISALMACDVVWPVEKLALLVASVTALD
jgi:hypothetical protein